MNEEQIEEIKRYAEPLFILGYATTAILSLREHWPKEQEEGFLWIIQAIENVVYQNKPMPPLPEVVFS